MAAAWVVRSGKHGEREQWSIANGFAGTGWADVPDLRPYESREALLELVRSTIRNVKEGAVANYAGQLWALRSRVLVGDLMALPLKTTKQVALGRVTGGYEYHADEPDPSLRHVIPVDWQRTDVPRSNVKQDLLFTLGSALTVFAPSKNNAVARLEAILATNVDPGQIPSLRGHKTSPAPSDPEPDNSVDEPEMVPDVEETAQIQISAKIAEEFAGHGLATLITALLTIDGFVCRQSPPGPDGGIDIIAGRGILGMDDPLVLVQVKSGGQVGAPVVQQLHGAMAQHGATQGLLVAWGGLSKPAHDQIRQQKMRVQLWEESQVVDSVLAHYDALPEDIRAKVPLKRVWVLTGDAL